MKTINEIPVWAPTQAELRQIEMRVRAERAKAFRGAIAYVANKVGTLLTSERAADKIHLKEA